ncbi:ABC transporter ATP-binding protein, partial [bacterium]|nr:ABC transporter ATP-binding protein [bacterium]
MKEQIKHTKNFDEALRQLQSDLPYLPRTLKMVWDAAHWWSLASICLLIVQGVLPVALVYLTRTLVNGLVAIRDGQNGQSPITPLIITVSLYVAVLVAKEIMGSVAKWVRRAQSELVQDHIHGLIHDQALRLDLSFFESPEYYNKLHRARTDAISRPLALIENIGNLTQNSITLFAMLVVLIPFGWALPLLLLLGTLPALFVVLRFTIRFHNWRIRNTANVRRSRYFDLIITERDSSLELRLFDLGRFFQKSFQALRKKLRIEHVKLAKDQAAAELVAVGFGLLSMFGGLLWVFNKFRQGLFTLGDLAMFFQAFGQGQRLMRTLLNNVGEVYRNIIFLENLFEFLELKANILEPENPQPLPELRRADIRFDRVSFSYPYSQRKALDNFNMVIKAGRITALVGTNGAGKSTLVKLLCRFYDPQEGQVTLGGEDLKKFSPRELCRQISVLFQEPVHYHASANDNIAYGDLHSHPSNERIMEAAREAGADGPIQRLPEEYNSLLG